MFESSNVYVMYRMTVRLPAEVQTLARATTEIARKGSYSRYAAQSRADLSAASVHSAGPSTARGAVLGHRRLAAAGAIGLLDHAVQNLCPCRSGQSQWLIERALVGAGVRENE